MKIKSYLKKTNVQIGIRLFFASVFLYFGNILGAAAVILFPSFNYNPFILATGAGAGESEAEEKLLKKIQGLIDDSQKENISKKEVEKRVKELNDEIAKLSNDEIKALKDKVDAMAKANEALATQLKEANEAIVLQGTELKKIKDGGADGDVAEKRITFRQALKEAFLSKKDILTERNDDLGKRLSLKDFFTEQSHKQTPVMTIKAAVDMFESNITTTGVINYRLTELDPQRVSIPLTIYPHVLDVFKVKGIRRPSMALLVAYEYWDGSGTKPEGTASGKSSFLFKTVAFPAFYIATHFVLSDETLDDLDEVLDEIAAIGPDAIQDKIDSKILGTAGDDVSDIKGIRTTGATGKSTAYATVFGAASIDAAYIVDVIADAKMQVEVAKYKPNVVYMNPVDVAKLAAKKNAMEDSQKDNRVAYGALGEAVAVDGLRVIKSTAIPANQFLVLDNAQPWIGRRRDMTMEIGYNGTDLTEGQKTLVIKIRVAFGVRDKAAIVWVSDIDAAVSALTKTI